MCDCGRAESSAPRRKFKSHNCLRNRRQVQVATTCVIRRLDLITQSSGAFPFRQPFVPVRRIRNPVAACISGIIGPPFRWRSFLNGWSFLSVFPTFPTIQSSAEISALSAEPFFFQRRNLGATFSTRQVIGLNFNRILQLWHGRRRVPVVPPARVFWYGVCVDKLLQTRSETGVYHPRREARNVRSR
jgi:hypothetical protein